MNEENWQIQRLKIHDFGGLVADIAISSVGIISLTLATILDGVCLLTDTRKENREKYIEEMRFYSKNLAQFAERIAYETLGLTTGKGRILTHY